MKLLIPLTLSFLISLTTSTSIMTNTNPTLTATASPSDISETSTIISDTSSPILETPYTYPPSTLYPTTFRTSSTLRTTSSLSTTPKTTTRTTTRTTTPVTSQNSTITQPPTTTPTPHYCYEPKGRCYCKPGSNGTFCGNDEHLQDENGGSGGCDPDTLYNCYLNAHDDPKQKAWIVGGDWCRDTHCYGKCVPGGTPQLGAAYCNRTAGPFYK